MVSTREAYCRICGYEPAEPPWGWDSRVPSYAFCPCCDVEWGYQDFWERSIDIFRSAWLEAGAPWRNAKVPHDGLTVAERLRRVGVLGRLEVVHVFRVAQRAGPVVVGESTSSVTVGDWLVAVGTATWRTRVLAVDFPGPGTPVGRVTVVVGPDPGSELRAGVSLQVEDSEVVRDGRGGPRTR